MRVCSCACVCDYMSMKLCVLWVRVFACDLYCNFLFNLLPTCSHTIKLHCFHTLLLYFFVTDTSSRKRTIDISVSENELSELRLIYRDVLLLESRALTLRREVIDLKNTTRCKH